MIHVSTQAPQDRRRLYGALQLRVVVDKEGKIRLSGIFDPDVYLPGVLEDPLDWLSPRPDVPEETKVFVDTSYSSRARVPWGRCWWPLSGRALLDLDGVLDPDPARPDHPRADAAATL